MELTSFKIILNEIDISEELAPYLLSIQFKDEDSFSSDEVVIELKGVFKKITPSDELKLYLGYEQALFYCGKFKLQTLEVKDNIFQTLILTSNDFGSEFKEYRNESYEHASLFDICGIISKRYKLKFKSDFKNFVPKHISQNNESDFSFLKRVALEYGALFSIKNETLLFLSRKNLQKQKPELILSAEETLSLTIKSTSKSDYKSCSASWQDTSTNEIKTIKAGDGSPTLKLNGVFEDFQEAKLKAEAMLSRVRGASKKGQLTIKGREVIAGINIVITDNLNPDDDQVYYIERVEHVLNRSGFKTIIEFCDFSEE